MLPGAWTETSSHQSMDRRGSPKLDSTEQSAKDWINQHRVNGWLSPEDKQRCLQEGRCFRCLEIGHKSTDCPTLRERRCASCQQMGHRARECPFENNQTSNQWFKGGGQNKSTSQPIQTQTQGSHRPDLGALPMDQLRKRILTANSPPCAPESDHARGRARPSVAQETQRCSSCQRTKCKIQDCPIRSLTTATTPQEEERRAKENLASTIRQMKAMPIEDRLEMITEAFGEEFAAPARIRVRQVRSIKPVTKEQAKKSFKRLNVKEQKEMALQLLKEFPEEQLAPRYLKLLKRQEIVREAFKEAPTEQPTPTVGTPVQIHTLQIPKKQKETSTMQTPARKVKQLTKEQVMRHLRRHSLKEQRELVLEAFGEEVRSVLTPTLRKLQNEEPVVDRNLTVNKNPTNVDDRIMNMAAHIRAMSTSNLTLG